MMAGTDSRGLFRVHLITKERPSWEVLADMPILQGSDPRVLDILASEAAFVRFSPSASIFERGSRRPDLLFVQWRGAPDVAWPE